MATFADAYAVKERVAKSLLKHPKVYGVGVGYRNPKHPKSGAAVVIYTNVVSLTAPKGASNLTLLKNKQGAGVPIRIVKTGRIRVHADYRSRIRPVIAGYSVGTITGSGTTGLIVGNVPRGKQWYIFSNNHVLTNPLNSAIRVPTLQPGGAENPRPVIDRVGYLSRFALLKKNSPNLMDAALSVPIRNSLLSPRYATVGIVPGHVTSYRVGERLKKVGRTTGLRYGTVDSVNTDIQVDYGENLGTLTFRNQTVVRGRNAVSLPGDSGSVWLRRQDNFAAAVNYAGTQDGKTSISFPIQWAMQRFRIRVAGLSSVGRIRRVKPKNPSYVRPLTAKELASIKIIQSRRQPNMKVGSSNLR